MRDYGKVLPSFWIGDTGKKLRGDANAQVLAMYLMTCPHSTWTGVYHCPVLYMAHETGLGMEGACKALARLIEVGFCTYEEASEVVFVVNMAAYQIAKTIKPEDKRHKGLLKDVENMSPLSVRAQFVATYSEAFSLPIEPKKASHLEAPSKPHASQEQEQEQEQKQEQEQEEKASQAPPHTSAGQESQKSPLDDVPAKILADYRKVRAAKRAGPLTGTALDGLVREAGKAGISLTEAITACCEYGWQGFRADWFSDRKESSRLRKAAPLSQPSRQEAIEARNRRIAEEWAAEGAQQ